VWQAKKAPAVVVVKSYDEPLVVFEGKFGDAEIAGFVEESTTPKLVEMDQCVLPLFLMSGIILLKPLSTTAYQACTAQSSLLPSSKYEKSECNTKQIPLTTVVLLNCV
jgi:hypothetical protein